MAYQQRKTRGNFIKRTHLHVGTERVALQNHQKEQDRGENSFHRRRQIPKLCDVAVFIKFIHKMIVPEITILELTMHKKGVIILL